MKRMVAAAVATLVFFPSVCLPADRWAEKLFPDPKECAFSEGSIYYDVDQQKIIITADLSPDVKNRLQDIGKKASTSCKAKDEPRSLVIESGGEFFGSKFQSFSVPIYGLAGGGCMSDLLYEFSFNVKAEALRKNILERTGKNLSIVPATGSPPGQTDDDGDGWITDYGSRSSYICSMVEF
ncbi:hypothetical protein [Rhizobium sp. 62_C5_N11_2]|uniref:hypothetical protein n=1 Tax=Rhizobium sp. 62_C5_N11_2 TaxID=3240772 RepID=UPI003F1E5110